MYVRRNNYKEFAVTACGYSNRKACVSFLRTAGVRNNPPPPNKHSASYAHHYTHNYTIPNISKKNLSAVLEQTDAAYLTSVLLQSFYVLRPAAIYK